MVRCDREKVEITKKEKPDNGKYPPAGTPHPASILIRIAGCVTVAETDRAPTALRRPKAPPRSMPMRDRFPGRRLEFPTRYFPFPKSQATNPTTDLQSSKRNATRDVSTKMNEHNQYGVRPRIAPASGGVKKFTHIVRGISWKCSI
jgi:hypothetical protein